MDIKDRACFNCEACQLARVPTVEDGKVSESAYWAIVRCRQRLSDHYRHYLELRHVCVWHSDSLVDDERYPFWRTTIDDVKEEG